MIAMGIHYLQKVLRGLGACLFAGGIALGLQASDLRIDSLWENSPYQGHASSSSDSHTATLTANVAGDDFLDVSRTYTGGHPSSVTFFQSGANITGISGALTFTGTLSGLNLQGTQSDGKFFQATFSADGTTFNGVYNGTAANPTSGWVFSGTKQAGVVSILLTPSTFQVVKVGGSLSFSALVAGSFDKSYTYTASGGTIPASGEFTAPATPGYVTVTAKPNADPTKSMSAMVEVTVDGFLDVSGTYSGGQPSSVTFFQSGANITGISASLTFTGTLSGRKLQGTQSNGRFFQATFSADGTTFSGIYDGTAANPASGSIFSGTRQAGVVSILLTPSTFQVVKVGGSLSFSALVAGSFDKSYTYTASGGTISASGEFTAPATPGYVTVTAKPNADPTKSMSATVEVTVDGFLDVSGTYSGGQPSSVTFFQSGASITGISASLTFTGTLSGRKLQGTQSNGRFFQATFSADGTTFSGIYDGTAANPASGTIFSGTRRANAVSIMINPRSIDMPAGSTYSFQLLVAGSLDKSVVWNASGGTLGPTSNGWMPMSFTAPQQGGVVTLTATPCADTTKSAFATVTVRPPTIASFIPGKSTVTEGKQTSLEFFFTGGTASIDGLAGTWTSSPGSAMVTVNANTTYTLRVKNDAGVEVIATTTVLTVAMPSIQGFSAAKSPITAGEGTTLTAFYSGGVGTASPNVGALASGEAKTVVPSGTTPYTLVVKNAAGDQVTAPTEVRVVDAPSIQSFTASSSKVKPGESAQLRAQFSGGTGVITPGDLVIANGGTLDVKPGVRTTYTLTVTNEANTSVSKLVQVDVGLNLRWVRDVVYLGSKEVGEVDAVKGMQFTQTDHLGSPRLLLDGTGALIAAQKYTPFGESLVDNATAQKFAKGFTGHVQTGASGIIDMQYRKMLPTWGRFTSPDPGWDQNPEDPQSWNLNSYVKNNPVMRVDPDGRKDDWYMTPADRKAVAPKQAPSQTGSIVGKDDKKHTGKETLKQKRFAGSAPESSPGHGLSSTGLVVSFDPGVAGDISKPGASAIKAAAEEAGVKSMHISSLNDGKSHGDNSNHYKDGNPAMDITALNGVRVAPGQSLVLNFQKALDKAGKGSAGENFGPDYFSKSGKIFNPSGKLEKGHQHHLHYWLKL